MKRNSKKRMRRQLSLRKGSKRKLLTKRIHRFVAKHKRSRPRANRTSVHPVSAILIVSNSEGTIAQVLEQLKRWPLREIIVIVHGSQDRTLEKVRRRSRAIIVHDPKPLEQDAARALAAKLAQSDFLLFIEGDMVVRAKELLPAIQDVQSGLENGTLARKDEHAAIENLQLTSIIIPTFNGLALLKACVASIRKHTTVPYEIIVVDNGSQDGTWTYCCRENIKLVSLPANLGFPAACNYGLRFAEGDTLLLLNNDTLVTPNWLPNLLNCLNSRDEIGMVGPVSNHVTGKQKIRVPFTGIANMVRKYNHANPGKWRETKRLVGFCMLMKREMFEQVGFLDERFAPGYFEDDDLSYRARLAGYHLLIAGDCFVYHRGSVSFRKNGRRSKFLLLWRNRLKFRRKWGVDPYQICHERMKA